MLINLFKKAYYRFKNTIYLNRLIVRHLRNADNLMRLILFSFRETWTRYGTLRYFQWFLMYALVSGKVERGFVPDSYYGDVLVPRFKGAYKGIGDMKILQRKFFKKGCLDIAYICNGSLYDRDYVEISVEEFNSKYGESQHIFKRERGFQSRGIRLGSKLNKWDLNIDGVIQPYIKQHEDLNVIMPDSVATIRVTTFCDNNKVKILSAYCRFGRSNEEYIKGSTLLKAPINKDGILGSLYDKYFLKSGVHPDSKEQVEGIVIPNYKNILILAKENHLEVPFIKMVGWDFAIDEYGEIILLEWNTGHSDIKFSEIVHGPIFSNVTK